MPLYEIEPGENGAIRPVPETAFAWEGIWERRDLQRLLRDHIEAISPDTLIVAEELSVWQDSDRRIDLLGVDKDANLVVIELKRDHEGGHMELQALRYAAMVSPLTFSKVVDEHTRYLARAGRDEDAHQSLLDWLNWDEPQATFNAKSRIVLAAANFSSEITTTVLWLNNYGLDIRCVRMTPYKHADRVLIDVQQVIPLPEAADYQVQIQEKVQQERTVKENSKNYDRFDVSIGEETYRNLTKGKAMFAMVRHLCAHGVSPDNIGEVFAAQWQKPVAPILKWLWISFNGELDAEEFALAASVKALSEGKQYSHWKWFAQDSELILQSGRTYALTKGYGGADFIDNLVLLRDKFQDLSPVKVDVRKRERGT